MFFKALLLVTVVSAVAAAKSNLTLLEGKLMNADTVTTQKNFIKLISSVIYKRYGSEKATATFVTGKHLLTIAHFLYDKNYYHEDLDSFRRVSARKLLICTSFLNKRLKVRVIYNQEKINKDDYRKEPAILQVDDQREYLKEAFPTIPTLPPDLESTADIFGLKLTNQKHKFSVVTFQSKIISKFKCSAFKLNKEEDPTSLCAILASFKIPPIIHVFDRGMPILTGSTIVGMYRKMPRTFHTKFLFVSTAGHHDWINNILNGNTGNTMYELEMFEKEDEDETTSIEDNTSADDETDDDE